MLMPSVSIAAQTSRQTTRFLTLVIIFSTASFAGFAQTNRSERSFPVGDKPEINIRNAKKISISPWDKNQVAMLAESANGVTEEVEINVQLSGNKLQILCPPPSEKTASLVLRVPAKSVVELRIYNHRIEIKKPMGVMNISLTENAIYLNVPESADLDFRDVGNVTRVLGNNNATITTTKEGVQHFDGGYPQIKVWAKGARVLINNPSMEKIQDQSTIAARTIATKNGLMSKALRQSHPNLISSRTATGEPAVLNAKESEGEALKLETYLVNLNVTVTDRNGKAITGLTQNDFSIYEEEALQNISFFSPEKTPFNLILLIDMSGSVREKIDLIKETALHFLEVISPQDKVAVVTFTTDVTVISHLTNNREQLRESIRKLQPPNGGTSFYDALGYVLVEELSKVKGQRNAIIAITDGQDNSLLPASRPPAVQKLMQQRLAEAGISLPRPPHRGSYLTFEQLLEGVLEADALIYPIYLMSDGFMAMPLNATGVNPLNPVQATQLVEKSEWQLQALTDASGSKLFAATKIEDLKEVYEQVAAELRTIYSVAYTPKNTDFNGKFRRIRMKVGREGTAVRTRQGYFAK